MMSQTTSPNIPIKSRKQPSNPVTVENRTKELSQTYRIKETSKLVQAVTTKLRTAKIVIQNYYRPSQVN